MSCSTNWIATDTERTAAETVCPCLGKVALLLAAWLLPNDGRDPVKAVGCPSVRRRLRAAAERREPARSKRQRCYSAERPASANPD